MNAQVCQQKRILFQWCNVLQSSAQPNIIQKTSVLEIYFGIQQQTFFFQIKWLKIFFKLEFISKLKCPLQGPSDIVTL